jgi:hypothetical protein
VYTALQEQWSFHQFKGQSFERRSFLRTGARRLPWSRSEMPSTILAAPAGRTGTGCRDGRGCPTTCCTEARIGHAWQVSISSICLSRCFARQSPQNPGCPLPEKYSWGDLAFICISVSQLSISLPGLCLIRAVFLQVYKMKTSSTKWWSPFVTYQDDW